MFSIEAELLNEISNIASESEIDQETHFDNGCSGCDGSCSGSCDGGCTGDCQTYD